ncbi:hypothetical protein NQ317_014102 [Molorchus minor]|uniref:Calcineurin-like phosphoesterase domain-containing protein n=1 Tax=Molorchus minor TaxID=1323400 RepID=A0ABQ9IUE8_9CUCU|nr:hypothetical protein NQ317_014102 [Molorchus minor]
MKIPSVNYKPQRQTLKILHLSDFHITPDYEIGGVEDCGGPDIDFVFAPAHQGIEKANLSTQWIYTLLSKLWKSWLPNELQKAEQNKQFVHILMHAPVGNEECIEPWEVSHNL